MDINKQVDPGAVLNAWRTRILNVFLTIVAVAAAAMTGMSILDAASHPNQWPAAILFLILELALAVLAIFRNIDYRLRAWGVLLVPYLVGVTALASFGLGSSGRIYLLAVPIGALILIGVRAGMFMSVLSLLTMAAFAFLADHGLLSQWLVTDRNSLVVGDWLAESVDTWMLIIVVMALLIMFYRFQERLIEKERNTQADLRRAQTLLEEQNASLEQTVQGRTGELQERVNELQIINRIQQGLAAGLDFQSSVDLVGDKLREVFQTGDLYLTWHDEKARLVHYLYTYEHGERLTLSAMPPQSGGLMETMVKTRKPVVLNTIADYEKFGGEILPGTDQSKSLVAVPIISSDRVLGIIQLENYARENAYGESEVRLLTTIAASLAAALENARLFDETQRLLKETEQRAAELATINSVQEGLASKLDLQAIYELIGEKVREVFNVQVVDIVVYAAASHLISMPYSYERCDRSVIAPCEPYGFRLDVINSCAPLLINQNFADLAAQHDNPLLTGAWPKSALFVPLLADGKVKGIISIQDLDRENAFSPADVRLLQTLANSMSVALENAHLFNETQRLLKETEQRAAELAIINSVQEGLAGKLDFQGIVNLIGDKVGEIFSADTTIVMMYAAERDWVSNIYYVDRGQHIPIPDQPASRQTLGSILVDSHKPLLVGSRAESRKLGSLPILRAGENEDRNESYLGVPILVGEKVIGLVSVESHEKNIFDQDDLRLLQTLANSMSVALENARLFNETQRLLKETEQRAAELAIINSVQLGVAAQLDMQGIYDAVGDKIREIFDQADVGIRIYDPQNKIVYFPYEYSNGRRVTIDSVTHMNPEELLTATGFVPHVFRTRATLVINENMPQEIERFGSSVLPGTQMEKSAVYVPLVIGDQVRGVIIIMDVEHEHAFSDSDVRLLQTLANSMSVALENARLFNETQRLLKETEQRAAELVTINTVSAALTGELEVNALIHLVGEQTRATFNADIIYVALLDEVHGVINFPYTYGEELTPLQSGEGLTSKILQMNQLLLINQGLELQTQELGATLVGKQSQSYLGVPIVVNGKAVGVLSVQSTTQEGLFDQDDARLLSTIASNVGTALHNAQLFTEVQNQRKFSEALIDFLPDATLVIDREGRVIAWNRAIEEMTGIQAENMLGKNNYEYALPFYGERRPILIDLVLMPRDEFEAKYAQIQRKGETLIGETYTPSLRGGRYMYATASVFHDARGDSVGAIETIRDITERKQAEVELQKAKDAADAANATKSAFLANMSHELRTPLNAIIGFTRIVRRKADGLIPEKQTDNLDKVLASAEHLLNLINTVLDIAKIESGRMDVLAANFRINALIDLCANTAQPLLRPGVNLEKQMDENLSIIHSDQDKIRQIILNLLSNAAKFTHEGKIILATHRDGKYLRVSVSDTGIGISDQARLHIFKEFQQADTSTTRQYGGTGLGLSISRNLAHLLGGDLTVESELGIGSTFTLVIPMQYGSGAASTPDRESAPVPGNDQRRASDATKKRILVIDDDPDAVYLLQENLNQNEFLITGARTGRDGLRIAREQQPQAILLDILMPETDGWQILNELKQDAATANIPVILLTIVDKKALGFRLGAAAYLLKPLDPVAVRDALNRVIGQDDRLQKYILVVDDDPTLADILRQFLPESEFRVESALDGLAGLEAIEAERPDILLLDIMMPRLDGFGVIEKLRANLQTRDLPIIVISAKDLTVAEAARLKETVAFVMKKQGFQGEQLLEEINSVLTA